MDIFGIFVILRENFRVDFLKIKLKCQIPLFIFPLQQREYTHTVNSDSH